MKEDNPSLKNIKGDNSREIIYLFRICDLTHRSSLHYCHVIHKVV